MRGDTPGREERVVRLGHRAVFAAAFACLLASSIAAPALAVIRFHSAMVSQGGGASGLSLPASLAIGDFSSDGILDVAYAQEATVIGVMLGRGDGTLAPSVPLGVAPGTGWKLASADFDGDGALDLAAVWLNEASVYFGDGTGMEWQRVALPIIDGQHVAAADVDGDGRPDLVALTYTVGNPSTGAIRSFLSRPGRTFDMVTSVQNVQGFSGSWDFRVTDFNNDGFADFAVSYPTGPYGCLIAMGDGTGAFSVTGNSEAPIGDAGGLDVGDATGDGEPDLIVARNHGISIYPLVDGAFQYPSQPIVSPAERADGMAFRDVTSDGLNDLVYSERNGTSVVVRPGLPEGGFGGPIVSRVDCVLYPFELADMNGDEHLDVVAIAVAEPNLPFSPGVQVAFGDGTGHFSSVHVQATVTGAAWVFLEHADLDQDGLEDVVALAIHPANTSLRVYRSHADRTLSLVQTVPIPQGGSRIDLRDLNGDGHPDVVVSSGLALTRLLGAGDGMFGPPVALANVTPGSILAIEDVTMDGVADLVIPVEHDLAIHPGVGDGTFGNALTLSVGTPFARDVRSADWNGDGRADFAITLEWPGTWGSSYETRLAYGSDGGLPVLGPSWSSSLFSIVSAVDLDGDGFEDLLQTATSPSYYWPTRPAEYRIQQPDGSLASVSSFPILRDAIGAHHMVDLDADGIPDLLSRGGHGWFVITGQGLGVFTNEGHYTGGNGGWEWNTRPGIADFDGDGRLDLLTLAGSPNPIDITILYGRDPEPPVVAVTAPAPPTKLFVGLPTTVRWSATDNEGLGAAEIFVSREGRSGPFARIGTTDAGAGEFEWTVTEPASDSVCFKVVVRDADGNVAWHRSAGLQAILPATDVVADRGRVVGPALRLAGPNPVRDRLVVRLALPQASRTTLALYDASGRRLATLLDSELSGGESHVEFSLARSCPGLGAGLYFLRLSSAAGNAVARLVILD